MTKIWYIKISDRKEGPYCVAQLKIDARLTPYTLVWRRGFEYWQELRYVPELAEVLDEIKKRGDVREFDSALDDEMALDMSNFPSNKILIILIILTAISLLIWVQQLGGGR